MNGVMNMRLSISNIAWNAENDNGMYDIIKSYGYEGIEIAPTRLFPKLPYEYLECAKIFAADLKNKYSLCISSMQSIWFGKSENIFNSLQERMEMIEYTKKAIDFGHAIGCRNLVFGCPKNRITQNANDMETAIQFFKELGQYAFSEDTVLSIEPNPVIYNTNFINTTHQAFELVNAVHCPGFKVNVDFGTIIYNEEVVGIIGDNINLVNHIHISEPGLEPIKCRDIHKEFAEMLKEKNFDKFISIEMKNYDNISMIRGILEYVKEVFE
jgi:sugar phosphate isomerase/epimerase